MPESGGMMGALPFQKGGNVVEVPFHERWKGGAAWPS